MIVSVVLALGHHISGDKVERREITLGLEREESLRVLYELNAEGRRVECEEAILKAECRRLGDADGDEQSSGEECTEVRQAHSTTRNLVVRADTGV